jgi:hypothetical protein
MPHVGDCTSRAPNISGLRLVLNVFNEVRDGQAIVVYNIAYFKLVW